MNEDYENVAMTFIGESRSTSCESIDTDRPARTFTRNQWSAATRRVLSSMPSRTIRCTGEAVSNSSHRDRSQAPRTSNKNDHMESHRGPTKEVLRKRDLLRTLQALSPEECAHTLRTMPMSLTEKSELKALACRERSGQVLAEKANRSSPFRACHGKRLQGSWRTVHSLLTSIHLWHGALKQVSGRFGTGALSYFLFLRTLLLYNVFFSLIIILFLVLPQVTHSQHHSSDAFIGLEILTGTGVFTNSLIFYGYYNYTEVKDSTTATRAYNISLAYFLTIGIGLFATCVMIVYSVSKTIGRCFHMFHSYGNMALKVFCSWDFKVSKLASVQMQSENLCIQLKETLYELHRGNPKVSLKKRLIWLVIHVIAWGISLSCIFFCVLAVYIFSQHRQQVSTSGSVEEEAKVLSLPLIVCGLNHLMPSVFNLIAWMESYDSINICIYVAIFRNLILKISILGVVCHHWLDKDAKGTLDCWETFVGQELYRFLLIDLLFIMLYTIFGDFLWRVFTQNVLRRKRKPVFDIARNILELIYGQTLAWLGVLFTPLLPTIQIVKLVLLFYLKKGSLMMNCQAPRKPWRVAQMTTLFITLLCFPSFLGAAAFITYTMWRVHPSSTCGPFRTLSSMFHAGKDLRKLATSNPSLAGLSWAYTILENQLFLFTVAGFVLFLIYFHVQVGDGQRRIIAFLQKQIENEGEDKKFLISKLQALHEQHDL
ncbi:transmembrane channel-like protein 6 [Hoplias malabaricus]|uniref:transmembrane channel-like protein 6 n=1 Tax=Hoplias malabaricus TaxID=27720 RepID=UPI003462D87E